MEKKIKNIPFSPPDISEDEIKEVIEVLKSGWITTGSKTKEFERKIAEYVGVNKAVCLNSATAAMELTLRILGIGPGDEVITTAYTYTASASVIAHVGAKIVLIDVQPGCLEMDYEKVESSINEHTKAVIPVDLGGVPCNYDTLFKIAEKKKGLFCPANEIQKKIGRVTIVTDAAHAFGAKRNGLMVGSIADFSSFSFHAVKNLTTAEGGALTWRSIPGVSDEEIYNKLQLLSLHGQSKDAFTKSQLGSWEYDIVGTWYKYNMTDIVAAIGLKQLERYPRLLARRREIIERYDTYLKPLGIEVLPHYIEQHESSGHLYITRVPGVTDEQRRGIIVKMAELGVACNVHYKPLPMMSAYRELGYDIKDYPNAYKHYEKEITLPLHTRMSDDDIEYVIECYKNVLKEYL